MSPRFLITGGPRCGKTTMARRVADILGIRVHHTDDLVGVLDWSEASAEVARWIADPGPWILEGTCVPRAIRKFLLANPTGKPADRLYWLTEPILPQTPGQRAMGRGMETVWRGISAEVVARGVEVIVVGPGTGLALQERP